MKQKSRHLLFVLTLMLGLFVSVSASVFAEQTANTYYVDTDGTRFEVKASVLSAGITNWAGSDKGSWYVTDGSDTTISGNVSVTGNVNLILADGTNLNTEAISLEKGASLTVYGQSEGSGKLCATSNTSSAISASDGDITINGGMISAKSTGSTNLSNSGIFTRGKVKINGGGIIAEGSGESAGIQSSGGLEVTNGNVTASGIIGIASGGITISGGNVDSTGSDSGIYTWGSLSVNGGTVIATTKYGSAVSAKGISVGSDLAVRAGSAAPGVIVDNTDFINNFAKYKWAKIGSSVKRTVLFKVVNGSWDDGRNSDVTVVLKGMLGDDLKLSADQIPAVGSNPGSGCKAGGWNSTPDTETVITDDMTYIYTYEKSSVQPAAGSVLNYGGSKYVVKSAKSVYVKKAANKTSYTVPASIKVKVKGKSYSYNVTGIKAGAFKGTKVTTLTIKSKKLTKSSVKNSLKGSKIKTITIKVGKKNDNKAYVKKYKKFFTKKNAGKNVSIK